MASICFLAFKMAIMIRTGRDIIGSICTGLGIPHPDFVLFLFTCWKLKGFAFERKLVFFLKCIKERFCTKASYRARRTSVTNWNGRAAFRCADTSAARRYRRSVWHLPRTEMFATSLGGPAKTPYCDGTTHVIFEPGGVPRGGPPPLDFIAKLAALAPKPRVNLTRFHGVLARGGSRRTASIESG
jgi:hypothetical protein